MEFAVEPVLDLFGVHAAIDDDFVDMVVSRTPAARAGAGMAETRGLVACAAWIHVLYDKSALRVHGAGMFNEYTYAMQDLCNSILAINTLHYIDLQ